MSELWGEEAVKDLTRLWDEGFSAKLIAEALGDGITCCAVIGKARRLGLPPRIEGVNPRRREAKMSGSDGRFKGLPKLPARSPKRELPDKVVVAKNHWQVQFLTRQPEMTKSQLRAEFAQAVRNTAAMPVE